MIGFAKIDKEALKQWADNEKESIAKAEDKRSACWYDKILKAAHVRDFSHELATLR